jgi:hypothetical protein
MATGGIESENVVQLIEKVDGVPAEQGDAAPVEFKNDEFTKEEQRKIIRKIDRRLVTGLGLLMGMCLMDRTNLGSTAIAGYAPFTYILFIIAYNRLTNDSKDVGGS